MDAKNYGRMYFKLRGLNLEPKAIELLYSILTRIDKENHDKLLDKLLTFLLDSSSGVSRVTLEMLKKAIDNCRTIGGSVTVFQVIDAFEVPVLQYEMNSNKFVVEKCNKGSFTESLVSDDAYDKTKVLERRYYIILQRLLKNKLFSIVDKTHLENNSLNALRTLGFLSGTARKINRVICLGMLAQCGDGEWSLEDPSGVVKLDLDKARFHKGLILEGTFVLVEGTFDEKVLRVDTIGMPPLESVESGGRDSIQDGVNYFGGFPANGNVKCCPGLEKLVKSEIHEKSLVFLSDVYVDKDATIKKLKILFTGLIQLKPTAFVIMGNLLSPGTNSFSYKRKDDLLASGIRRVVQEFVACRELAEHSHLVFVPGPTDPYLAPKEVLPRPRFDEEMILSDEVWKSIPGILPSEREHLRQRILLASNPCRLTFYDQEIVVFRDDFCRKIYSHCLHIPAVGDNPQPQQISSSFTDESSSHLNDSEIDSSVIGQMRKNEGYLESHLVWTMLSQAHLLPLPMHVSPVYWGHDQAMRLFPTPDLVVMADPEADTSDHQYGGCLFMLLPSFTENDRYSFKHYYPSGKQVQNCNIDESF